MESIGIKVNAPLLNQYLGFAFAIEQIPLKQLISELAIEAFAVAVLPRTTCAM